MIWRCAGRQRSAVTWSVVWIADTSVRHTIRVAIGIVRSARRCREARWLERESGYLLPVEYHHVVFTLPAELAELALTNAATMYNLLMQSAAETLREVAANPKRLGAEIGVLMVLHTWGQNLHHHPHVHCVVTGGGLSCNARGEVDASPRWVSCRPGFFLPVRVLSRVFRGKFLAGVRALHCAGEAETSRPAGNIVHGVAESAVRQRLGGVREASVRRTGAGAEVPGAVYASGGAEQPSSGEVGRRPGDVPL